MNEIIKQVLSVDVEERVKAACDINTPAELLCFLSGDENVHVRVGVAGNPNTTAELLCYLSRDVREGVREHVAWNPNTPEHTLLKLSKDVDAKVRSGVARNRNASTHLLERLSKDKNEYARMCVAHNSNVSIELLYFLSQDVSVGVRTVVAENPNTPAYPLEVLSNDKSESVRTRVACNPNTLEHLLLKLSKDNFWNVRSGVASNANITIEIVKLLIRDVYTTTILLKNRTLLTMPAYVIEIIYNTLEPYQKMGTNHKWNLYHEMVQHLAVMENTPVHILEKLIKDVSNKEKVIVASNPKISKVIADYLANSIDFHVRMALVGNPRTPESTIEYLSHDYCPYIANAATDRLFGRATYNISKQIEEHSNNVCC